MIIIEVTQVILVQYNVTANTICLTDDDLTLGQRRRRWPNINPSLVRPPVFSGSHDCICMNICYQFFCILALI